MSIVERNLTDIIDTGYHAYAMYVLESRAIPSVIDGLKPVQRKLLYSMINEYGGKKVKVADFGGISKLNYLHGEVSAIGAAIAMSQKWNNNACLFDGHGNFGSKLVTEASAPRYIYASLSDSYKKYFMDESVSPIAFDPENPEPAFYLPVIPWILVNGVSGIAVGFKTDILPRSTADVLAATKKCLKNPEKFLADNEPIKPTYPDFRGEVIQLSPVQWKTRGIINAGPKNTYVISELPVGYDRETYVTFLNELTDADKIRDYDDECSKAGFGFTVKVSASQKEFIEKDVYKFFKMEKTQTEILTTMGSDGKLKIFQSVAELIHYFCAYRTMKFDDKIEYDKQKLRDDIEFKKDKAKFIQHVIADKVKFKDTTKAELISYVESAITSQEYGKRFVSIPLYDLTKDALASLLTDIELLEKYLDELNFVTGQKLFAEKLNSLKN